MTTAIEGVLQQLRSAAAMAGAELSSFQPNAAAPASGGGFAGELKKSLDKVSDTQDAAYSQAKAFELGAPNVSLNDVMVDMQKANVGFQMSLQVRNKLVTAYQDIMNMQA